MLSLTKFIIYLSCYINYKLNGCIILVALQQSHATRNKWNANSVFEPNVNI